jgi:dienelactone hydrolase
MDTSSLAFEDELSQRIADAAPELLFTGTTQDELSAWQDAFRSVLVPLLGKQPERVDPALELVGDSVDCGSYTRQKVTYRSEVEIRVPAYLLIPNDLAPDERRPGLLCIHGHGQFGKDSVVGLNDTPERQAEIDKLKYDYGQQLAEDGFVVLAPDLRGFGERSLYYPEKRKDHCYRNYMCATLLGTTVMALNMCDLYAGLDVLATSLHVDAHKLGCVGLSLGGRMTMMMAALDHRISIAVPSGCMNLFQERYQAIHQCGAQLIPGLLRYGDTPEIFSLVAPRPMVVEIGTSDPLIPHEWRDRGLARVRKAYAAAGIEDQLFVDAFDGGHAFNGTVARPVLQRWRNDAL